jgi:methyltransferase (TIGR00027 family)
MVTSILTANFARLFAMANPISKTAYYTLAVRAWDAAQPKPVLGDTFAKVFMNEEAEQVWQKFKDQSRPNASNAARHAIIDSYLQGELNNISDSQVIIIGAGFDTRAFRLKGGKWIELDEPAIITYKESRLPESKAPNPLKRIAIEFAKDTLTEKLAAFSTSAMTHIIIEGVLMYLTQTQRENLILNLQKLFPHHIVYCDLMRLSFFEKYSKEVHDKILSLGASFTDLKEQPDDLFTDNGYTRLSSTSVPLYAVQHANSGIGVFLIKYFLKTLREGYRICRFEY